MVTCNYRGYLQRDDAPERLSPNFSQKVSHVLKLDPKLSWFLNILIS